MEGDTEQGKEVASTAQHEVSDDSPRDMTHIIDRISKVVFPLLFILFIIMYWAYVNFA